MNCPLCPVPERPHSLPLRSVRLPSTLVAFKGKHSYCTRFFSPQPVGSRTPGPFCTCVNQRTPSVQVQRVQSQHFFERVFGLLFTVIGGAPVWKNEMEYKYQQVHCHSLLSALIQILCTVPVLKTGHTSSTFCQAVGWFFFFFFFQNIFHLLNAKTCSFAVNEGVSRNVN